MEFTEYVEIIQRRWKVVAAAVLLGVLIAFLSTLGGDDSDDVSTFRATHTLVVDIDAQVEGSSVNLAHTALFVTAGEVPRLVAESLGYGGTPAQLAATVEATANSETDSLRITARNEDPERAAEVANAFGDTLLTHLIAQNDAARQATIDQTTAKVDAGRVLVAALDAALAENPEDGVLLAERDSAVNEYRVAFERFQQSANAPVGVVPFVTLERATPVADEEGFGPPESREGRMLAAGIVGLVLGLGLVLVLDRVDTRVRTAADAEAAFGVPVVGEIPLLPRRYRNELVMVTQPASPFAESFRSLRSLVVFMQLASDERRRAATDGGEGEGDEGEGFVVLVTSPMAAEGKTTVAAHLGASFAESGQSVLLLDCDFRRPRLSRLYNVSQSPGLSELMSWESPVIALDELVNDTDVDGVSLVPSGKATSNPAELFRSLVDVVEATRKLADVVIIDTPPLLIANDAVELVPLADVALIAARVGRTRRDAGSRTAELLRRVHANDLGVVLVGAPTTAGYYRSYYYYRTSQAHAEHGSWWRRGLGWVTLRRLRHRRRKDASVAERMRASEIDSLVVSDGSVSLPDDHPQPVDSDEFDEVTSAALTETSAERRNPGEPHWPAGTAPPVGGESSASRHPMAAQTGTRTAHEGRDAEPSET